MFMSTKLFGPFSACFRQAGAESHCRLLHGYGLTFRVEFGSYELDANNWVIDFGGLKGFKSLLEEVFDHKLVVAATDPDLERLSALGDCTKVLPSMREVRQTKLADVVILPAVGCESFASYVYNMAEEWLSENGHGDRVRVARVECFEHNANSAIYQGAR